MQKHFIYYFSLIIILCMGFSLTFYVGTTQKQLQMMLSFLTAFLYATWGILHHILHHSLSVKIMLEYIAIAILGTSIIFFVLNIAV
jgi:hypothetical protein